MAQSRFLIKTRMKPLILSSMPLSFDIVEIELKRNVLKLCAWLNILITSKACNSFNNLEWKQYRWPSNEAVSFNWLFAKKLTVLTLNINLFALLTTIVVSLCCQSSVDSLLLVNYDVNGFSFQILWQVFQTLRASASNPKRRHEHHDVPHDTPVRESTTEQQHHASQRACLLR